jgi:hypothetical protein
MAPNYNLLRWVLQISKNKKLSADRARDNHAALGPTPPPSSRPAIRIYAAMQQSARPFLPWAF